MKTNAPHLPQLNLPQYPFRIKKNEEGKLIIHDTLRHKNVRLTPEEWVRQHIIRFLIEEREFPASLISVEAGLKVNRLEKRYDALIFDRQGAPLLLLECKAPEVNIGQNTFDQIASYNLSIKAGYLLVTNGMRHYCCRYDNTSTKYIFLPEIPLFSEI